MQFTILACLKDSLQEKFDKLNKKCEKYGNELLSFSIEKIYEENNQEWADIIVSGITPRIGDYELISVISKLPDGTNIINNVPGKETPLEFRENNFFCDHCKENRYRKEVVIVLGPDGYKQLGKTCLKDYLGIDLENLVNRFTWIYSAIEESKDCDNFPRQELSVSIQFFLERASVCIRKFGYTSSKAAWDNPLIIATKEDVWRLCFPRGYDFKWIAENELEVNDKDRELAKNALEWALNLEGKNDFEHNVKNIAKQESVGYKYIGYLSAIIPCYEKFLSREVEKSLIKNDSQWVGQEKERLEDEVKCVFTKVIENEYDAYGNNIKTLVKFVTKSGNNLTWFATGEVDFNIGEEYKIKFTVKKHDTYNNEKQTMVSRVKIVSEKVLDK